MMWGYGMNMGWMWMWGVLLLIGIALLVLVAVRMFAAGGGHSGMEGPQGPYTVRPRARPSGVTSSTYPPTDRCRSGSTSRISRAAPCSTATSWTTRTKG